MSTASEPARDDREERPARAARHGAALDPTDPMVRSLHGAWPFEAPATTAPSASSPEATVSAASRVSLEHLLPKLVRRIAWSGDAQSGTARLELGEGTLEGATLTIHSDRGAVRVSLELPPGADAQAWKERIARRLDARGLYVAELEVR